MAEKSMNDLVLNNEPDFRLLRLILLDSYSPGGEAIIVLRDGAIMTGENGSGKTSLIRLIPIFLGENPGKVNVGTEGFINFYLARTTSYIIFEYQRRDMVCQAVLYAGNEDSYTYRFIRTGYDLALYTDQDGKTLLANASLGTHLKTMGILHSRALAMSEYRAIIQGHYSAGKDAGNQRAYVHDYAFTSGNQRLDHIDKIVSGMFTRQANFRDFLRMVVSYITEDERAIAISGDRAKIGKWPEHYTAYQEVMRHSDHMEQISALGAKLLVNDDAIKVLHARFRVLIDHHEAQQRRLNRDHADAQELIETARLDHEKKVSAIREKEQAAGGAAKQVTDQAARIRQQHDAYRLDGISDKAAVVAALEANKASLDNLKERKGLLLGAKAGIDQRYTALKLDVEKAFVRTQMESTAKTHAVEAMFAPRLAGLALEQRSQEQVLREASRILRDEKQALLDTAIGDRASWLSLQANPVADGVIEQALVVKQAEVETARSAVTLAEGASIKASQIKMEAVATFQRLEKQVQEAQESLDQQEKAIKALIASANPAADSLLGFLREHYPGWTDGVLAKEGIDTERLQALEAEIEKVGQMISDAGKWADLVAAWNLWHRDEWPRVPVLEKEAAEHVKAADRHKERRERLESDWAARLNAELKHIKAIADGARLSGEIAQQARTKLPRLEDFEPDSATLALHYDPLWTADELAAMANKQFSERRVHESDLKGRVREIKSAFRSGRGSPTEQYFETIEGTIDPDDDNPRAWIEPFRLWYDRRHEEFLRTLLLEAQSYGRLINRFKDDIDTFDRQIKDFNRGMRFALGRTIVFPRIGQITVTFSSTINDKSYWQPIREFVENHQAWISGFGRELPPPSFSEGLGRLMQHWEMREGIKADRLSLIEVSGKVVENGKEKAFVDGAGLKELSSNGLSYLILTTICVAFLQMIRGDAKSQVTAAVDEILDLDSANIGTLVKMLRDNGIDLISACPDADLDVMMHFKNRYKVIRGDTGPEIHEVKLIDEAAYV